MEKQILIVENGAKPASDIRDWVFRNPVIPVFVGNGIEALLWLGKGNIPDLIFAEVEMGLMPGIQFVQYLKASGFFNEIPIIAFGNPNKHEGLAAMMQAGANDYLVHSVTEKEIAACVDKYLPFNLVTKR
jgi:CheY-like chemotaxis protein